MEWGKTPWQFDSLHADEKAEMMAFVWSKRTVDNFIQEEIERSVDKK